MHRTIQWPDYMTQLGDISPYHVGHVAIISGELFAAYFTRLLHYLQMYRIDVSRQVFLMRDLGRTVWAGKLDGRFSVVIVLMKIQVAYERAAYAAKHTCTTTTGGRRLRFACRVPSCDLFGTCSFSIGTFFADEFLLPISCWVCFALVPSKIIVMWRFPLAVGSLLYSEPFGRRFVYGDAVGRVLVIVFCRNFLMGWDGACILIAIHKRVLIEQLSFNSKDFYLNLQRIYILCVFSQPVVVTGRRPNAQLMEGGFVTYACIPEVGRSSETVETF